VTYAVEFPCRNCGDTFFGTPVGDGFCSDSCQAAKEHEEKFRANEHMSILVRTLDDGAVSVQFNFREPKGVREMVRNYDTQKAAILGIAAICTAVAASIRDGTEE
jgi:hypothetical protein